MKRSIGPRQAKQAMGEAQHISLWAQQVHNTFVEVERQMIFDSGSEEYDEDTLQRLQAIENTAKALRERLERTTKRVAPEDPREETTTCTDCGQEVPIRYGYGYSEEANKCPAIRSNMFPGHRVNAEEFRAWEGRVREYETYQQSKGRKARV